MSANEENEEPIVELMAKKKFTTKLNLSGVVMAAQNLTICVSGTVEGPNFKAEILPPSADWLQIKPNNCVAIDVRIFLKTDDGEMIYQHVTGRSVRDPENPQNSSIRCMCVFETNSEKYLYLNQKAYFGHGIKTGMKITLDYYDTNI